MYASTHPNKNGATQDRPQSTSTGYEPAGRIERLLFFIATAVLALHVADDNFIQPEPGTYAGDHLPSGLVPLAFLGMMAAIYSSRRPGARAVIALLTCSVGVSLGLEGGYQLLSSTPSGDDFSSLLALPAGAALLGLAAVTLWRSKRTEDGRVWRYSRRALLGAAGLVLAVVVVAPFLAAHAYTHLAASSVPEPDLGAPFQEVSFETEDGLELQGWYVPSRNGAAVISFPGRRNPQDPARLLADHGYGVLLFDRRGEGESEGEPNAWGWGGYRDLDAAVEFLRAEGVDPDRIGGIGQSVGGEMMLEAAARSDGLKAVVMEGAGIRSAAEAPKS